METRLRPFITKAAIDVRIAAIAHQINQDYQGKTVVLLGVMNGAFMFMTDLVRRLSIPVLIDFISLSSYEGTESSGEIAMEFHSKLPLKGQHVLVIEDIVETGLTASYLIESIQELKPASVKICSLLDKPANRAVDIEIAYVGITIQDLFVVGFGMDYDGRYRNLSEIYHIEEEPGDDDSE